MSKSKNFAEQTAEVLFSALSNARRGNYFHAGTLVSLARSWLFELSSEPKEVLDRASQLTEHVATHCYLLQQDELARLRANQRKRPTTKASTKRARRAA